MRRAFIDRKTDFCFATDIIQLEGLSDTSTVGRIWTLLSIRTLSDMGRKREHVMM